jgi:hypothetical protein
MTTIWSVEGKDELDGTGVSTATRLDRRRLVDHYVVPVEGDAACGILLSSVWTFVTASNAVQSTLPADKYLSLA